MNKSCFFKVKGWNKSVQLLVYADDLDAVGRTERDVAMALGRIEEECHSAGLNLNVEKTKVMKTTRHPEGRKAHKLGEYEYEVVQNFMYLGSSVNAECSETGEIKRRIGMLGIGATLPHSSLFKSRSLSWSSKLRMYKSLIRPVVSYGSET